MAELKLVEDWWQDFELDLIMELSDWPVCCLVFLIERLREGQSLVGYKAP